VVTRIAGKDIERIERPALAKAAIRFSIVLDYYGTEPPREHMLWCYALLPNGMQGHWFYSHGSPSFVCKDRSGFVQVLHQCPVHRGVVGATTRALHWFPRGTGRRNLSAQD
jgi:hypothetical protein